MTSKSLTGSRPVADDTSTRCTSTFVRSRWLRKRCPRPWPSCAPSIRPGTSATTNDAVVGQPDDAEIRRQRRERVVGDLRPRGGDARNQRRLAGVRKADEPDVRQQLEMEPEVFLFAGQTRFGPPRRAVRRRRKVRVSTPAEPALRDQHALARLRQIRDLRELVLDALRRRPCRSARAARCRCRCGPCDSSLRHARRARPRRFSGSGN